MPVPLSPRRRFRPHVLELEGRLLPSTFTVTVPDDSGPGSLRQAILDNNATPGLNTIAFHIGDGGVQTIRPTSALPTITNPVVIDGTTQPGYAGAPLIELTGADAGANVDGLTISAGDSTVTGLVINGFSGSGLYLQTNGHDVVSGNYFGTDVTGTRVVANGGAGIVVNRSQDDVIGGATAGAGNLSSGNTDGLVIGGLNCLVEGNFIGTDVTGTRALGNNTGIELLGDRDTVGGTTADARNLISGNATDGILDDDGGSNLIEGNFIGTDVSGTQALGNGQNGIYLRGIGATVGGASPGTRNLISSNRGSGINIDRHGEDLIEGNYIGTDVTGTQALGNAIGVNVAESGRNQIGGTEAGAGNLISGNGVGVSLGGGSMNQVQGNFIGSDATGTQALGNGIGVEDDIDAGFDTVGGTVAGAGNLISGNQGDGLRMGNNFDVIQGNRIGTDISGAAPLGNGDNGVEIVAGEQLRGNWNTIGGATAGAGNTIAFNGNDGLRITHGRFDLVSRNSIFASGNLGIELLPGVNNDQAFPTLDSAVVDQGSITISGSLQSTPDTTFTLEFFGNDVCNPSGYGEGQHFLGASDVHTDDSGAAAFSATFILPSLNPSPYVSATATDPAGSTSAFAQCVAVTQNLPQVAALVTAVPVTGMGVRPSALPATPGALPSAPPAAPALPVSSPAPPVLDREAEPGNAVSPGGPFATLGDDLMFWQGPAWLSDGWASHSPEG